MKFILLPLLCTLTFPISGLAREIIVDSSSGTSLPAALKEWRTSRQTNPQEPGIITLEKGLWEVLEPIDLGPQDSGLTIRAKNPGQVILTGAPKVTDWQAHSGQIVKANISALLPKNFLPRQLLFDGQRQPLARYPNFDPQNPRLGGWAFVEAFPPSGPPEGHRWKRECFLKSQDVRKWAHPEEVELNIFAQYGWWNFVMPVSSIDPATRKLTLAKDCSYDLHPHNRYLFENALEELDAPGEWYFDRRSGELYFWPPAPLANADVRLPTLSNFFRVKGAAKVILEGLQLTGCHGDALTLENCEDCLINRCEIKTCGHFSGSAVTVSGGKNNRVERCDISFTGSNGVNLSGGDRKTLTGPGNAVENCHIHDMGVFNKNACGISIHGVNLIARHNHIHHGPRMGVQLSGNNIAVDYNHLHHLVLETQDGGAIYTGGRDWISSRGSSWSYNLIHDIVGVGQQADGLKSPWFTFGLYPDDNAGGIDLRGNIVFRCATSCLHLHNSRDCLIENNIFAGADGYQWDMQGWTQDMTTRMEHLKTMIKGYESVQGQPAWAGQRGMNVHPEQAIFADGTMMSGNVFRQNIIWWNDPTIPYIRTWHCSPQHNLVEKNLVWNGSPVIRTGSSRVGADQGDDLLGGAGSFAGADEGSTPKGWGFNHRPRPEIKLIVNSGALTADCAQSDDPKNPRTVFHSPEFPLPPGAGCRARFRLRCSEPESRVDFAIAAYASGKGYWQSRSISLKATSQWQEFEVTGAVPLADAKDFRPWMKSFWLRIDAPGERGTISIDKVTIRQAQPLNEWDAWQAEGWDQGSLVADPKFLNPAKDNFRLQAGSPAFQLGFKAIPVEKIGIQP